MINFGPQTGNIFPRLGSLAYLVDQLASFQATLLTIQTDVNTGVVAQYNSESDIQAIMGDSYIGNLSAPEAVAGTAQSMASATVNRIVFRDNPQLNQTLTQGNLILSIREVIRQMKLAGATILAQTVTATPSAFIGTGNGVVIASVRRPFDGLMLENAYAETITATCTRDSYNGGATAGNETFAITGQGAQTDLFAFNWPLGSNCSAQLQAIDGDVNNGSGNLLRNSGFTNWSSTSAIPNNWTLTVGTAGTNFIQETSIVYGSTGSSVKLVGDASGTLVSFQEAFNATSGSGTSSTLSPQTQYGVNLFLRTGATPPSQGVLTVDLVDGNNVVVNDAAGTPNSFTVDLTTLTTSWSTGNGAFRTPVIMPSSYSTRLRLSTALGNGDVVYLDKLSLGQMTQSYTGGPFFSVHAGSTPFVAGDYATTAVTNSRGAAGTLNTFQTALYRLLAPVSVQNEVIWPSSSVPSIPDALIT